MLSKKFKKKAGTSTLPITLLFPAALFVAVLGSGVMGLDTSRASDKDELKNLRGGNVCSNTAKAALRACNHEIKDDFWIAVGKCNNLSDASERATCLDLAKEELEDSEALCKDQREARLELCEELGETPYDPQIDPAEFVDFEAVVAGGDFTPNPYFPLVPGKTRIYIVKDAEGNKPELDSFWRKTPQTVSVSNSNES